jgi:glycosyltransferase involved in cell wall biosynthesis
MANPKLNIAYVARYDVTQPSSWSRNETGLAQAGVAIYQGLINRGHQVTGIGPLHRRGKFWAALKRRAILATTGQTYHFWAEPGQLHHYARQAATQLDQKLSAHPAQVVLTAENAIALAKLERPEPQILWLDSSMAGLIDFYPYMTNLWPETRRQVLALEAQAFARASTLIMGSDWAAHVVQSTYGVPAHKIHVLPWGPNVTCDRTAEDIAVAIERRPTTVCRLLFVGVHWDRKGGDLALAVVQALNNQGVPTELTIVGCTPPATVGDLPPYVTMIPFIDKSTPTGMAQMNALLAQSHFFILPTQAECLGLVLAEALSHGVPCLTSDVGGVPTVVRSGQTGETFPLCEGAAPYVATIRQYWEDRLRYNALAASAFDTFDRSLRWERLLEQAERIIGSVVQVPITSSTESNPW